MSLIGKDVAIVSLGMSCQTAHQLKRHVKLLAELTGDSDLQQVGMPCDWVIRSPMNNVKAIQECAFFPESAHELTLSHDIPYWDKIPAFYWHDFDTTDLVAEFDEVARKYRHVTESFETLRSKNRNIFVISNIQNNLEWHDREIGRIDYMLNQNNLSATAKAIAQHFPDSSNEFLVVSYKNRIAPDIKLPNTIVALFPQDPSEWEGSDSHWQAIFQAYFK